MHGAGNAGKQRNRRHGPLARLVGVGLDRARDPHADRNRGDLTGGEAAGEVGPAGHRLDDPRLPQPGVLLERGLERRVVENVERAVFLEIPLSGRLQHHVDLATLVVVDVEHRMAGLGQHVLADLDQIVPGDVLEIGGLVAGLGKIVGAVEEAGDAGIERQRVGLAVDRSPPATLYWANFDISMASESGSKEPGNDCRYFCATSSSISTISGSPSVLPERSCACSLVLTSSWVVVSMTLSDDVGMGLGVDGAGFPHGDAVEVGIPAPDRECRRRERCRRGQKASTDDSEIRARGASWWRSVSSCPSQLPRRSSTPRQPFLAGQFGLRNI